MYPFCPQTEGGIPPFFYSRNINAPPPQRLLAHVPELPTHCVYFQSEPTEPTEPKEPKGSKNASKKETSVPAPEPTEAERAEAAQYSALFGGAPKKLAKMKAKNRSSSDNGASGKRVGEAKRKDADAGAGAPRNSCDQDGGGAVLKGTGNAGTPSSPLRDNGVRVSATGGARTVGPPNPPASNDEAVDNP